VGKTALAVALAQRIGAELINADSRQVIRGLNVATCTPTAAELDGVTCHLTGLCDPGEDFTVADWLDRARMVVDDLDRRAVTGILVGGTGLFIDALVDGFSVAGNRADPAVRAGREDQVSRPGGLAVLVAELGRRDPQAVGVVDLHNPRRVIRALEILDAGEGSLSHSRRRTGGRPARLIGVDVDRTAHQKLIRDRAERMFAGDALLDETVEALKGGIAAGDLGRSGIGYAEAMAVLRGELTRAQAIEVMVGRTLRYAKSQRTWFRHRPDLVGLMREPHPHWVDRLLKAALERLVAVSI